MEKDFGDIRIGVMANRFKTRFYHAVFEQMGIPRENIFWICTGQPWLKYLTEAGYRRENIYYYEVTGQSEDEDLEWLRQLEQDSDTLIWRIIQSDRLLSKRTRNPAGLLSRVGRDVEKFLLAGGVKVVFGELTWSVELLTYHVARRLGIHYLTPHTIRIPAERFAFFLDPVQRDFLRLGARQADWERLRDTISSMVETRKPPKPRWWFLNNRVPRAEVGYIGKFFRYLKGELLDQTRTEYMDYNLGERFANKFRAIRRGRQLKSLPFMKSVESLGNGHRLALYTLHKQPEASVDVMGGLHTDQAALIGDIARSLPADYLLLVKEHSNAIGDRGRAFYERILPLGNVRLVDPWIDSHSLFDMIDTVFTVSGTVAMETSIAHRRAITFSECFFTKMPGVHFARDITELPELLHREDDISDDKYYAFFETMISNSFDGLIGDPLCFPDAMQEDNLKLVAEAFTTVLRSRDIREPAGISVSKP